MQPLPDLTPTHQDSSTPPPSGTVDRSLPQVPWTGRDTLWGVIIGLSLMTGLTALLSVGLSVYGSATGRELGSASGLVTLLAELTLLLPVWWFAIRKYRLPWSSVGLRRFAAARSLGLGFAFLLLGFWFNLAWSVFLGLYGLTTQRDLLPLFGGGRGGLLLALFTGGLIAPIAEELFFRGFVFGSLHKHLGLRRAAMLNAILFALVHIFPTSWPPIFVLGVLFALLYERTGSIWPAVVVHGVINALSFLALYAQGPLNH